MSNRRFISAGPRVFLALATLLGGSIPAIAQRPALRTFGVADGLPSEVVGALLLDSRGFLWVGHRLGVSRFDGTRFVNYGTRDGLPGFIVYDLLEDRAGRLWVATNRGGIARFDPDRRSARSAGREPLFRKPRRAPTRPPSRRQIVHGASASATFPRADRVAPAVGPRRGGPVGRPDAGRGRAAGPP